MKAKAKAQIILVGSAGRVGQEITKHIESSAAAELYASIDHKGRGDFVAIDRVRPIKNAVVVDFSTTANFRESLAWAVKMKLPFISGTTGLSAKDFAALGTAAKTVPLIWSSNMSPGICLFLDFIENFGKRLAEYDLLIEEAHHKRKKDAPSGTAKTLQSVLVRSTKKKWPEPISIRGGGIFGVHKLWVMGEEETITFEHTALNRKVFARGAIAAAAWINKKKPGLYAMRDVFRS